MSRMQRDHAAVVARVARLQGALEDAGIVFDNAFRAFRHKGRVVRGLTPILKRTLWPRYNYKALNDRAARRFRQTDPALHRASDGRRRGTRVHSQVEVLTNSGPSEMKRSGQALHPYTKKLFLAMRKWGWRPVASEIPLVDPISGIATAADMVCSAPGGKLVLVETKTGYFGTWNRASRPMDGPLSGVLSDSPQSQALVQALLTKRMMELHGCVVDKAYVVRIHAEGVEPVEVHPELDRRKDLVAAFVAERSRSRRQTAQFRPRT